MPDPSPSPPRNGSIDASFMGAHLTATGNLVVIVLCVLAIMGTIIFSGYRIEQAAIQAHVGMLEVLSNERRDQLDEHHAITRNQDIQICMAQLLQEERLALRRSFSNRALEMLCPWISAPTTVTHEKSTP